jgi:hypothetical protein
MRKAAKLQMTSIFNDPKKPAAASLLTKEALEKEKHIMDLAMKKKKLGIDHRKFHLMGGQATEKSSLMTMTGFPLKGLIKPKKISNNEGAATPSTDSTTTSERTPTLLSENYGDSDDTDDADSDAEKSNNLITKNQSPASKKHLSLVDY